MNKILVLFTGGTIGCSSKNGIIDVDSDKKFMLIEQYQSLYGKDIEFESKQILNVLSENITLSEWQKIAEELNSTDFSTYSGVIITHGSDTLAYTSAFIGMLFRHSPVPIVLTASNLPVDEKGTNGLYNFTCAVKVITDDNYKGVFTVYEEVFLSTRIQPADTCLDKFSSYGGETFYKISQRMLNEKHSKLLEKSPQLLNDVLKIHGYPNIDFSNYDFSEKIKAMLYVPYHSGTACMKEGSNYSISLLAQKCEKKGIPLYVCGIKKSAKYYSTLDQMLTLGIKPLGKISDVSAYMKLLIGINQDEYTLDDFMGMDIYYENVD